MKHARLFIPALSGFLLAVALGLGGLTRPDVIIGWVDVFGSWNPQLFVFFVAAVVVYYALVRMNAWQRRRAGAPELCLPTNRRIDARLLIGSSIFGIGWAIGGACPGPALTTLGAGASWAVVFVAAMVLGLTLGAPRATGET
jgi:uncharacterized membrane protein YedE/YeeE